MFIFFFVLCEVGFEAFGEFTPCKHNTPPASFTFESDIRAETRNSPFVGAARMLFAESQVIVEAKVGEHGFTQTSEVLLDDSWTETNECRLPKSFDVNIIN